MTQVIARRPSVKVLPGGSLSPIVKCIWLPLNTGTGTTTGAVTKNGFSKLGAFSASRLVDGVVNLTTDTPLTWRAQGGLTFGTGNGRVDAVPDSGDARQWMTQMLDLSSFSAGETLMVGCVLTTPAGHRASNTGSWCVLSVGDLSAGNHGYAFQYTSAELPSMIARPVGAAGTITLDTGAETPIEDAIPNAVVWELLARGSGRFDIRTHLCNAPYSVATSVWKHNSNTGQDLAATGTAAPGMPDGTGLRFGSRREGATNAARLQNGQIVEGVILLRFEQQPPASMGARVAHDLRTWPQCFPVSVRKFSYDGDSADNSSVPDGNADEAFGVITQGDMLVALNGKRAITAHPAVTVQGEHLYDTNHPGGFSSYKNTVLPNLTVSAGGASPWVAWNGSYEGLPRINPHKGGLKFGRTALAPASVAFPAFQFSSYSDSAVVDALGRIGDTGSRGRSEAGWMNNASVYLPRNVPIWVAGSYFMDFDIVEGLQHVTFVQFHHDCNGAKLNPPFAASVYATKMHIGFRHSSVENMVMADQVNISYELPDGYTAVRGRWFDFVMRARVSWDPGQPGFAKIFIDDKQVVDYVGPIGYKGPAAAGVRRVTKEAIRTGAYPGTTTNTGGWSPDTTRDVYCRRFFACTDVGNYTLAQIRAALAA